MPLSKYNYYEIITGLMPEGHGICKNMRKNNHSRLNLPFITFIMSFRWLTDFENSIVMNLSQEG